MWKIAWLFIKQYWVDILIGFIILAFFTWIGHLIGEVSQLKGEVAQVKGEKAELNDAYDILVKAKNACNNSIVALKLESNARLEKANAALAASEKKVVVVKKAADFYASQLSKPQVPGQTCESALDEWRKQK